MLLEKIIKLFKHNIIKKSKSNSDFTSNVVTLKDNMVIVKNTNENTCFGFSILTLKNIPLSLLSSDDVYILNYVSKISEILYLYPDIHLIIITERYPKDKLIKKIENEINRLSFMVEFNYNPSLQSKLRLLSNIYENVTTNNYLPMRVSILFVIVKNGKCDEIPNEINRLEHNLAIVVRQYLGLNLKRVNINELIGLPLVYNKRYILGKRSIVLLDKSLRAFIPVNKTNYSSLELENLDNGIYIGIDMDNKLPVFIDLRKHIINHFVIAGPTGRGKTTLLALLVSQMAYRDVSVVVIDFKGDLIYLLNNIGIKGLSINLNELLNINIDNPKIISKWFMEVSNIIAEIFRLSHTARYNIYRSLMSLHNLSKHISLEQLLSLIKKYSKLDNSLIGVVDALRELDKESNTNSGGININNYTPSNALLISLRGYPEKLKQLLASLILAKEFTITMYSSLGMKLGTNKIIVIDEAWRMSNESIFMLSKIYREGRSLGIGVIASTQLLTDMPPQVLENTNNFVLFSYNSDEYIDKVIEYVPMSLKERQRYKNLGVGEALVKLHDEENLIWVKIDASHVNIESKHLRTRTRNLQ